MGDESIDFSEAFGCAFAEAPALRTVETYGCKKTAEAALPWSQLRTIRVEAATADDFFDVLNQNPNITRCRDKYDDSNGGVDAFLRP